jgi:hypothetical protein
MDREASLAVTDVDRAEILTEPLSETEFDCGDPMSVYAAI